MESSLPLLARTDDVVTRRVAGQTVVVPVRSSVCDMESIFTLNRAGSLIWELLDGRTGVEEIAEAVSRRFTVTPDQARGDVVEFLKALQAAGLARDVNPL